MADKWQEDRVIVGLREAAAPLHYYFSNFCLRNFGFCSVIEIHRMRATAINLSIPII